MNLLICLFIFTLICHFAFCISENYTLVLLPQERDAACLDGTPVGLYIHEGKGSNMDNFVVYFEGGGYCGQRDLASTLESCYQRTNGRFGTTKVCQPTTNLDRKGIIATTPELNPVFYDWTKIYLIYCDGAQYFGSRPEPIPYKDKKLYFRGTNNVLEQIKYLEDKYDIFRKNKIVVTGVSAGGIATYFYANLFKSKSLSASVYAIPDSGLFITDYVSPLTGEAAIRETTKSLIDIVWGQQRFPIENCLQQYNNDIVECFNAANIAKYLTVPTLIIQSAYDHWSMENILGATCYTNPKSPYSLQSCNSTFMAVINDYKEKTRFLFQQMLKENPNLGVWSPSCVQHGFTTTNDFNSGNYRVPGVTGKMMTEAIEEFLAQKGRAPVYIDEVSWPLNLGCNGLSESFSGEKDE